MMGIAQDTLDVPITKGTSGFLFFTEEEAYEKKEYPCIRCGRCVQICPMNLLPCKIYSFTKNKDYQNLEKVHPKDCIECGCCAFVCPSGIPLVGYIKWAKTKV